MEKQLLQELYARDEYYWGKEPNSLAHKASEYFTASEVPGKKLLDLGCGEGRDSIFFTKHGFNVLAIDFVAAGLAKAERLAKETGILIRTEEDDLNTLQLVEEFDVIYSCGALEYIEPPNRLHQFAHFKEITVPGGIHFLFVFVEHPEVELAPDWGANEYLYRREELQGYYTDWTTLETYEYIFPCNSSDIPHHHAARILVTQKPA